MKFSTQFIERVSDANNIVDIIGQHTQLKSTGSGMMGRCPFPDHPEKTPSFSVSESKQVYHCFGCGKSGNIFTFLRDYQGLNFPDAVEYLANRANIPMPLPEASPEDENRGQDHKKLILKINKQAQSYFSESLRQSPQDHPVREYLIRRGINSQTVETFGIGYAPSEWEGFVDFCKSRNIPLTLAEEAQLVKPKGTGGYFDLFKDRLMFPIQSVTGDVLAFGGRILAQGNPKYLNSPETPIFQKGKVLYGLPQTGKYIRSEDLAVVVEGYMDLVSLYQAGIKNVVAIMGTALTTDHAKMIKRMTRNVLVLLDGDQAGQLAAERALPHLLAADLYPKGLALPLGKDPDDFVKTEGANELQKLIKTAPDLVSLMIKTWLKEYRGEASQKVKFSDQIRSILGQITDQRLRELYMVEASQHLGVDINWMRRALSSAPHKEPNRYGQSQTFSQSVARATVSAEAPVQIANAVEEEKVLQFSLRDAPDLEKRALAIALKTRANFEGFLSENGLGAMTHSGICEVFTFVKDVYGQDRKLFDKLLSQLVTKVDDPQALFYRDASTAFTERKEAKLKEDLAKGGSDSSDISRVSGDAEGRDLKLIRDIVKRLKEMKLKVELKAVAQSLKLNPSAEKFEQMKRIQLEIGALNKTEDQENKDILTY